MNRFRTKKRAKDSVEGVGRSLSGPDGSSSRSFSSKSIRRGKKAQAESKPEVDLSTALPSSDNFRTSLLMPNLSARFSMLREQDDPTSKLGKANDDSVLFPKRASRLNVFSHPGLSDIAESAPLDSIPRPFASERVDSYYSSDGYGTDDDTSLSGSVMGRPKHREGNNLFGGRQKIYKIPVGSSALAKNVGSASVDVEQGSGRRMVGRALYGDDVSTASFQKLWEKESEESGRPMKRELVREEGEDNARMDDPPASPSPAGYNRSRETSSSTASGPSNIRTSTAATSIASQSMVSFPGAYGNSTSSPPLSQHFTANPAGPERATTRSRRLYGHGLDQQMQDQQSSALYKLDTLQQRQPAAVTPQQVVQSQSALSLQDQYRRAGSPYALPGNREVSPPPPSVPASPSGPAFGTVNNRPVSPSVDRFPIPHVPTSPDNDGGSVFSSAVQPNDRGKATALGAFNKPSRPYDEQQYSQRQFQLQSARDMSPVEHISSPPASKADRHNVRRRLDGSDASSQARSVASSTPHNWPLSSPIKSHESERVPVSEDKPAVKLEPTSNGTFFAQSSDSDERSEAGSETEEEYPVIDSQPQGPVEDDQKSQHRRPDDDANDRPEYIPYSPQRLYKDFVREDSPARSSASSRTHTPNEPLPGKALSDIIDADSPTLGPASGLSGLVRAHLRNDSGQSSIYPPPSPVLGPRPSARRSSSEPATNTSVPAELFGITEDSAWAVNQFNGDASRNLDLSPDSRNHAWKPDNPLGDSSGGSVLAPVQSEAVVAPPWSLRAKQILDQAAALKNQERLRMQHATSEGPSPHLEARTQHRSEPERSWQGPHEMRHQRTESTETEKERQEFATELSNRRKIVEENLKSFAEDESRSNSPMPSRGSASQSPTRYANAFGPLRSKPTKGSLAGRQDPSFKAMKMLGMNGRGRSPQRSRHDYWEKEEQKMLRNAGMAPTGPSPPSSGRTQYQTGAQPTQGFRQRQASDESYKGLARRGPSPPSLITSQNQLGSASLAQQVQRADGRTHDNVHASKAADARGIANAPFGEAARLHNPSSPQSRSPDAPDDRAARTRSPSTVSGNGMSRSHAAATEFFGTKSPLSSQTHNHTTIGSDRRPYPETHTASNHRPTIDDSSPTIPVPMSSAIFPETGFPSSGRTPNKRKKSVNKSDISDPTFLSGTSSVNTRNLPTNERLAHRGEAPVGGFVPPVPPINPRRKTAQQTIAAVFGRGENSAISPTGAPSERGRNAGSSRNGDAQPHVRQRLRKSSSEGSNLGVRARQQTSRSPPPALPLSSRTNGGMF